MTDEQENEKLGRRFYEAIVPGHRGALRGLQAPHVIYDLPQSMPIGCGHCVNRANSISIANDAQNTSSKQINP